MRTAHEPAPAATHPFDRVREAALRLFMSAAHPVLLSSHAVVQLLCEALVGEVIRRNPASVARATELAEWIEAQLAEAG